MNYDNPPEKTPLHLKHDTFYSQILNHAVGYNIYLPPQYETNHEHYPVVYHFHGWTGHESTEIWIMEAVYKHRNAITVFVNAISSETEYDQVLSQIEYIFLNELIIHIDSHYRTNNTREHRMLSGFSMGGNIAFYLAVKHHNLFGAVTAYAGTFHHLYQQGYRTVGVPLDQINSMYEAMKQETWYKNDRNILALVTDNADHIRGRLNIILHVGTSDILLCDNEIMHRYLDELNIPHQYKTFNDIDHKLEGIL